MFFRGDVSLSLSLGKKNCLTRLSLDPSGWARVASTAFYSFFSPSLPPSFSEPRSSSSSRSCRDPAGFIVLSRCGSIWIDFVWGCSSPRHAVDDALERESEKKREVVSSCPRRKEKKEKNQKSPSPPLFFLVFWVKEEEKSL